MSVELKATEYVTPPVRLSFPALFEAKPVMKDKPDDLKFMATLLIPDSVNLAPIYECVKAAMIGKWGKVIKLPARNNPIKDCGEKDLAGYEDGWHYVNAKSKYKPNVVDQNTEDVIDPDRIYPGCWCRFHLIAFAWDHPQGGKGVSFSLSAVQLVKDDERLDGRKAATDVFDPLEGADGGATPDETGDNDAEALFG